MLDVRCWMLVKTALSTGISSLQLESVRPAEYHHRQRGKRDRQAVPTVALRRGLRRYATTISYIAAAEVFRIRIQNFPVEARRRNADVVLLPQHRGEVADDQQEVFRVFRAP